MTKPRKPSSARLVRPVGLALLYINPNGAPYRLVTRRGMSTLYKGRRRVWSCNSTFAALHFEEVEA